MRWNDATVIAHEGQVVSRATFDRLQFDSILFAGKTRCLFAELLFAAAIGPVLELGTFMQPSAAARRGHIGDLLIKDDQFFRHQEFQRPSEPELGDRASSNSRCLVEVRDLSTPANASALGCSGRAGSVICSSGR